MFSLITKPCFLSRVSTPCLGLITGLILAGRIEASPTLALYPEGIAPDFACEFTTEECPPFREKVITNPLPDPHFAKYRWPCIIQGGLWAKRQSQSTLPAHATILVPKLKACFLLQGLPQELAWVAEVESMLNTNAVSITGARGLFQFKPESARRFGLLKETEDFRSVPDKSARAAAQYLAHLYTQFGDWTLSVAAYNAGEGCVGRLLKKHKTNLYADIAPDLPAQTQVYVIKVMTTIALRENTQLSALPPPSLPAVNRPSVN